VRLRQIEAALERVFEGAFARVGGGRLHPLEVFEALRRRMEEDRAISSGGVYVPNRLVAHVAPSELDSLGGLRDRLEQELAAGLQEQCRNNGWLYGPMILVRFCGDDRAHPGRVRVTAAYDERPLSAAVCVQGGLSGGQTYPVTDGAVLGRAPECQLVVPTQGISRHHCRFDWDFLGYRISDLGSTNGTFVNGVRVTDYVLCQDDLIEVGGVGLRFHYDTSSGWAQNAED
jgi:hypothetical protein